jgi:hypothetical protein
MAHTEIFEVEHSQMDELDSAADIWAEEQEVLRQLADDNDEQTIDESPDLDEYEPTREEEEKWDEDDELDSLYPNKEWEDDDWESDRWTS